MELKKLEKIKIGKIYFYKHKTKKVLYSKIKKLDEYTLNLILNEYKRFKFEFI